MTTSLDRRTASFMVNEEHIDRENGARLDALQSDYEHLGRQLLRRGQDIEQLTRRATAFQVAVPSWGVGTGGTRFARFAGPGEPRDIFEKVEDCAALQLLVRTTPSISIHIPWD